jgi:hypothetical protein
MPPKCPRIWRRAASTRVRLDVRPERRAQLADALGNARSVGFEPIEVDEGRGRPYLVPEHGENILPLVTSGRAPIVERQLGRLNQGLALLADRNPFYAGSSRVRLPLPSMADHRRLPFHRTGCSDQAANPPYRTNTPTPLGTTGFTHVQERQDGASSPRYRGELGVVHPLLAGDLSCLRHRPGRSRFRRWVQSFVGFWAGFEAAHRVSPSDPRRRQARCSDSTRSRVPRDGSALDPDLRPEARGGGAGTESISRGAPSGRRSR